MRDNAAAVEATLMREGHNRIALYEYPLVQASFDPRKIPARGVLVRQQVWAQRSTLLGYAAGRSDLSVIPELSFHDALWARLQAISRPVSVCGHKADLDPSPCIAIADLSLDNPFAYLDRGGAFHFRDNVGTAEILSLARSAKFELPVDHAGSVSPQFPA